MAGQLYIKLLVASVYRPNLTELLIFFDFILFVSWFLQFSGTGIHSKKCCFPEKFPAHVIISILQAFRLVPVS